VRNRTARWIVAAALFFGAAAGVFMWQRSRAPRSTSKAAPSPTASAVIPSAQWKAPDAKPAGGELKGAELPDPSAHQPPLRDALARAVAAVRDRPTDADAWGDLAMLCHANELLDDAAAAYERAEELTPHDALWPHLLGRVYESLSRTDDATRAYERSIAMEPHDVASRCSLARILTERNEDERARQLLVEAVESEPRSVAARVALARLALRSGVLDMAEKNLLLALDESLTCGPAHELLAQLYERRGDEAEAEIHHRWSRAGTSRIPLPDPYIDRVEKLAVSYSARLYRARRVADERRWSDAIDAARAALEQRSGAAEPRYLLGIALVRGGRVDDGLRELRAVTELDAFRSEAWIEISRVLVQRGEGATALATLDAACAALPDDVPLRIERAGVRLRGGDRDGTRADVGRALELQPDSARAFAARGDLYQMRGADLDAARADADVRERERNRAAQAVAAYERALELAVDLPEAYAGAGRAHMQLWELAEVDADKAAHVDAAIAHFRPLVRFFPRAKAGHVALIRALDAAGRHGETLAAIRAAAERWPDDPRFRPRKPAD